MKSTLVRLIVLVAAFAITWGASALIPAEPKLRAAAVVMSLPSAIDTIAGHPQSPSEQEISLLAADTEFEKRLYTSEDPDSPLGQLAGVSCGIVLSGHDLNNSIHRPERCLVSQGFQDLKVTPVRIDLADGRALDASRVESFRNYKGRDGESYRVANLNYYWFVGSQSTTPSHYTRTLTDMKDRILGGFNQRWAYFSVSSNVLENLPGIPVRGAEATDQILRQYIREVTRHCVKDTAF